MQEDEVQSPKRVSKAKSRDRNRNALHGPEVEVRGEARLAKLSDLRPNPWNYNTQSESVFNKLVASMRRHGFTQRITVRQVPGTPGWEIINGEHRWRAAGLLGIPDVPVDDLGEVSDQVAKELTIILNELGGKPDDVRLGDLLRDIKELAPIEELVNVMPFSESELDMYIGSATFDFATLSGADTRPPEAKEERDASPVKTSKKEVRLRWGGLSAYDVEKTFAEVKERTGAATVEDAIVVALRHFLAPKGTP